MTRLEDRYQAVLAFGMRRWWLSPLIGLAVVTSFQAVGTLLVFALLVAPPATGVALHVRSVPAMMLTAVVVGIVSVVTGLVVSYHADTAAGFVARVAALARRVAGDFRGEDWPENQ